MDALASYWLNRLAVSDTAQRHDFSLLLESIFTALTDGHTVIAHEGLPSDNPPLTISVSAAESGQYAPIVMADNLAWLHRTWQAESALADLLAMRMNQPAHACPTDITAFTDRLFVRQIEAMEHAACHNLTLINGGPGTGKTFTLARLVGLLHKDNANIKIALAAPTGKAAKRMEESLRHNLNSQTNSISLPPAQTLHRLLGIGHSGLPDYHQDHYLPFDVVIVDEASMLSLDMAYALFAAVSPQAKLVLLGDAGQLAAVDPGAVLHDLSHHRAIKKALVTLDESSRFSDNTGIGKLATLLQQTTQTDTQNRKLITLLHESADIEWHQSFSNSVYRQLFTPFSAYIDALKNDASPEVLLELFDQYRILCAGHHGSFGAKRVNLAMMQLHRQHQQIANDLEAFHGMPLMVTSNDYRLGIFNGDIGLCLQQNQELVVYFPGAEKPLLLSQINPAKWLPAYALTIHKSQGSEYRHVALILEENQRQSCRELLYTGVTRAKKKLSLYASEAALLEAANKPIRRSTGLGFLLDKKVPAE